MSGRRGGAPRLLLIGYGNELRGDDAVGPAVARAVASWELPGVETLAAHQLTPELAAALAAADAAIFVDAWQAGPGREPLLLEVGRGPNLPDAHTGDPGALLALAEAAYGRRPQAWQLLLPATSFAYGAALSPDCCRAMLLALRLLRDMVLDIQRSERCMRSA